MINLSEKLKSLQDNADSDFDVPNVKMRAAIYVRKSNKDEGGKNKSCDEQLERCLRVCVKYGFEVSVARIYQEEEGVKGDWWWDDGSGYHPGPYRPELTQMMKDIDAGLIDAVVIWRSDRLYRDAGVCDGLMKIFRARNIRFVAGLRDMDVNSASGLFSATTEAANNRRWRDIISEDIKRDHTFKAEMGMFSRDPSCLGFRSKGRGTQEVEVVPEEIALINRIFRLFTLGEEGHGPLGVTGIANFLMDEGVIWPKGSKGHKPKHPEKIHTSHISTVLNNVMYVGSWRHDGKTYVCNKLLVPILDESGKPTGKRETAVPLTLFEAAQEKLARADRPGKRSLNSEHLLSGLAVCARCGRPLQIHYTAYKLAKGQRAGEPRPPRSNFTCNHKRGTRPCPPGSIFRLQEPILDQWAMTELSSLLMAEIAAMRASAGRETDVQTLAELERKLKETRHRETKQLAGLIGVLDAEQFGAVAAQLRVERESFVRQTSEIRKRLETSGRALPDLSPECLATMPKSTLKDAFSRAIEWIAVGKTGIVALTRWGTYIGAAYRDRDRNNPDETINATYLCAAEPATTLTSLALLTDPEEFVRGRRDALGKKSERLSDAELLPGLLDEAEAASLYIPEGKWPASPDEQAEQENKSENTN